MWSRRAVFALAAVPLAACGFAPVYGPSGEAAALRGAVRAADPATDETFAFVRRLEERLGRPDAARYDLGYALTTTVAALAIDGSDNITRLNVEGRLDWTLTQAGGGAALLTGRESAFTGYSAPASTISTLASERDARRRLAIILADKVVTRLLAEASGLPR